jgi:hypothetical protein
MYQNLLCSSCVFVVIHFVHLFCILSNSYLLWICTFSFNTWWNLTSFTTFLPRTCLCASPWILHKRFWYISECVIEWFLFNANSSNFQLYHGKNKLIFKDTSSLLWSRHNRLNFEVFFYKTKITLLYYNHFVVLVKFR